MNFNSISKTVPRCFLSCEAETDRDTHLRVASSLTIATIRERAQVHQDAQDAVETDQKELDESKQMPAGAQSTDPGGDAEAQVNCRLRTNV